MKQIFAVVPLSKKLKQGQAQYGIQIRYNGIDQTSQIWKTLPDYLYLQKQIKQIAFDFQPTLQQGLSKAVTDEEKLLLVTSFVNQCKCRPDITNLVSFREFFYMCEPQFQYLDQWNRVKVGVKDMAIIAIAWDSGLDLLFVLHKPHSKTKIITNFIKQLLSQQTCPGLLTLHSLSPISSTPFPPNIALQSQPIQLVYNNRSKIALISTTIGINMYTVQKTGNTSKIQLIDFVKVYNPVDMRYGSKSGRVFVAAGDGVFVWKVNQEVLGQVTGNGGKLQGVTAIQLDQMQARLYAADHQQLRILDITDPMNTKVLAQLRLADTISKLLLHQKYLFSICEAGYTSIYKLQAATKQHLTCTLTSLDIPPNNTLFAFNCHNNTIICSNNQYIVLISTKNIPLFAGGNHKTNITAGIYYHDANAIVVGDLDGFVVFYAGNFKIGDSQDHHQED